MSDPKKKTFKVPVTWEMVGFVEVEAPSLGEAVDTFDPARHAIPTTSTVVPDSFRLNLVELDDEAFDSPDDEEEADDASEDAL